MLGMNDPTKRNQPEDMRPSPPSPNQPIPGQPVQAMPAPPQDIMGDYNGVSGGMVSQMQQGLSKLAPEELARLDAAITPELGMILTRAFGPEFGQLIAPLMKPDTATDAGAEPMPETAMSNITAGGF